MRLVVVSFILLLFLSPALAAEDEAWAIHAHAEISTDVAKGLQEIYAPMDLAEVPASPEGYVQWTWWSWSAETDSSWPDDDALYRATNRNVSLNASSSNAVIETHVLSDEQTIDVGGKVKVVSAEDRIRMVAFDLTITPLVNLSNHTILYVVLTEKVAEDDHRRQVEHLVREMRPEVGFSVKANTPTSTVSILPTDHLEAAGVNLAEVPTGWSYTVAVFGSEANNDAPGRLLALAHGDLPAPSMHTTSGQTWTPLLLSAITAVVLVSIVVAVRQREGAIPRLHATWSNDASAAANITLNAGAYGFRITTWSVAPPWRFKGRPPKLKLSTDESKSITVEFREPMRTDCHIEVAIEIEDYGAWKQHLWLQSPSTTKSTSTGKEEE